MRERVAINQIDEIERAIIDRLQGGFPVCEQPFAEAAVELGIDEEELLSRLRGLLEARVLTRFGPMFQVERMGGAFVLAAMCVPDEDWERVVATVNSFLEVAHNYRRESEKCCNFNMWFVLATETPGGIDRAVSKIEEASGLPVYAFPKIKEYFVEMKLQVRT